MTHTVYTHCPHAEETIGFVRDGYCDPLVMPVSVAMFALRMLDLLKRVEPELHGISLYGDGLLDPSILSDVKKLLREAKS